MKTYTTIIYIAHILILVASVASGALINKNNWDAYSPWVSVYNTQTHTASSIEDHVGAPSPPNVLRFKYRAGFKGGNAPDTVYYSFKPRHEEIYFQFYFKFSVGYQFHTIADKLIYLYLTNNNPHAIMTHYGSLVVDINGPPISYILRTSPKFFPDKGKWYKITYHVRMNTPGLSNGVVQLWVDDVLRINQHNINWRTSSDVKLRSINISPVFGGSGNVKTAEDYVYFDSTIIQTHPFDDFPDTLPP